MLIWLTSVAGVRLLFLLPHREIETIGFVNISLQLLLCILSIWIARNSVHDQRHIFINFAFFFAIIIPLLLSSFIGSTFLAAHVYAPLLYHIYVNIIGLTGLTLFIFLFVAIDHFRPQWYPARKYILASVMTLAVVGMIYQSMLWKPLQLYDAVEFVELQTLKSVQADLTSRLGREPNGEELEGSFLAAVGKTPGDLRDANETEVRGVAHSLVPFLESGGEGAIFWRPIEYRSIAVRVIVLCVIASLLISFYRSDRAVSAYIDKVLLVFFIFIIFEILHAYASTIGNSSVIAESLVKAGQYVTVATFIVMVYAFDVKRRFINSVTGKFYEEAIHDAPEGITRLRDEIDTLILNMFFNNPRPSKYPGHFSKLNQEPENGGTP